tara:strand:- start:257 stop:520 length:264 start_codon:yes stop_codon:yes gene_type:complete
MNCNNGISIPTLGVEECGGDYTNTNCVINPNIITYLNLPANSTMTEIVTALVLALQYKDEQINILQTQINNLQPQINNLHPQINSKI